MGTRISLEPLMGHRPSCTRMSCDLHPAILTYELHKLLVILSASRLLSTFLVFRFVWVFFFFFFWFAWALQSTTCASLVAVPGLSCPKACGILVPRTGIEPAFPCIARWILNHWTTRQVPVFRYFGVAVQGLL